MNQRAVTLPGHLGRVMLLGGGVLVLSLGCDNTISTNAGMMPCTDGQIRLSDVDCGEAGTQRVEQACVHGSWEIQEPRCMDTPCALGQVETKPCGSGFTQRRQCEDGNWSEWRQCRAQDMGVLPPGDSGPIPMDARVALPDARPMDEPNSSDYFNTYIGADHVPGRFPASSCQTIAAHHDCVSTAGCNWLRTIKNNGVCRKDPVARCIETGECACEASDFHGAPEHDNDLEVFVPLSILWQNLAPRTSERRGGEDQYSTHLDVAAVINESLANFTSRTDFTNKTLTVRSNVPGQPGITDAQGLSLTVKLMHVWDVEPSLMTGTLFDGLGLRVELVNDRLSIVVGDTVHAVAGESPMTGRVKTYQCNQFALVVPEDGVATAYLGGTATPIPGLNMATIRAGMADAVHGEHTLTIGALNAKVWDLRLYTNGRELSAADVGAIGKRCGALGDYQIPHGYPESNRRYSWGMGGYDIIPNHQRQHFSSGVYVTMWIPEAETLPSMDSEARDNLKRMIGFWDRWHEQMFFEMDMIPFIDTRDLEPVGSLNAYRNYRERVCRTEGRCGEPSNYNNPCRYTTDLFQAFNWLPEDFPGEPTSADHRRIARNGGWTRWDEHDPALYGDWQRPVHEHGHAAHFTLMRTYLKVHHYIRGIAGESFAEIMSGYVLTGLKSWMNTGLTYYPTIPIAFEGRWDSALERHVFKSDQPYQSRNIDDQGLGARFYGLGVWWMFVSHYAAKPYLIGRLAADRDQTTVTPLQKMRFYLAQEGFDLGELFGNYAAHVATWDWPQIGHHFYEQEQEPFQGIANWCTENSGPDCTIDSLKIQADVPADVGTDGEWVDSPEGLDPGGFAYSTIRIANAPAGARYAISLEFEVPEQLYEGTEYHIGLPSYCRDDPRFFSSRIVIADVGSEGQAIRENRPHYYKIPGRSVQDRIIEVPAARESNIYLLAVPTPPFELEDVPIFVHGHSLTWPFRYKVTRMDTLPDGAQVMAPIVLHDEKTLDLTAQEGNGFTYDCFARD